MTPLAQPALWSWRGPRNEGSARHNRVSSRVCDNTKNDEGAALVEVVSTGVSPGVCENTKNDEGAALVEVVTTRVSPGVCDNTKDDEGAALSE
jgi:hypothetical protein